MALATPAQERSSLFQDRMGWYLGVSAYWFATSFKWFIAFQLLPLLVADIVPSAEKDLWWGRISGLGAIEAMVGPAIFGYMSDRFRSRYGRRQPFLAVGAALTALALLFLGNANQLWMFFLGYMLLQISDDVGTGPYAALVPDYVPENRRGRASGILSQMQLIAQIVAAGVGFILAAQPRTIFVLIAVINILCAIIVIVTVREDRHPLPELKARPVVEKASGLKARLIHSAQNWITPWQNNDFRWVWFTRFLNSLGFYIILNYIAFYLKESVRVFQLPGLTLKEPFQAAVLISLLISLAGAVSSVWGGDLADRIGRKRVVYVSGWLMFVTLIPFSLVPNYALIVLLSPVFGIGYGAYLSATWAMAADTLPSKEDAAKDMGIWQMSVAAPQVIAGFAVSLLIYAGNQRQPGLGYTGAFLASAGAFLAGSLLVKFVRGSS